MSFSDTSTRIGWIGTGVMGTSMCGHLIDAGYRVTVYSRTRERAQPLLDKGADWADTPAQAARGADVVFTMVGYPADVREVILGEQACAERRGPALVIVDMTTSEPSLAQEISEVAREHGVASIDAPVSGGDVGARNATLSIMVGGDADDRRGGAAAVRGDGQDDHPPGPRRGWPAHQDGQPDADRDGHDRRLRGAALRLPARVSTSRPCSRRSAVAPRAPGRSATTRRGC